jgi:hypothetical protein
MMHRNGPANATPNLGAVLPRGCPCDVNAGTALALDHVVHGFGEALVLHQVNASIPCDGRLKDDKTAG